MEAKMDLIGKTALVTGGSRGVGRDTALALAKAGADVVLTYRAEAAKAAAVVAEIEGMGRRAQAIQADLTGTGGLPALVAEVRRTLTSWGAGLDILIPNAGIVRIGGLPQVTEADLNALWQTNYVSVFFLIQALEADLRDSGRIVLIGSGVARKAFGPLIAYGPLKAAIQALVPYLAQHFGKRGITVNAVAPGGLDDDFNAELFDKVVPGARAYIAQGTALGRVGLPADVGGVIAALAGPAAGFVNGQVVGIDGGFGL
jgi:NAD(P)-dependent dehydrogenase (short-subunit alcohol dehydrogenase family)